MTDPYTITTSDPLDDRIRLAGRYRIDGLLGSGGMSEVSYGYDERLDRPVAIKLLRPPGNPPGQPGSSERIAFEEQQAINEKRFLREIRTTASLEYPGIPAVFDTGVHSSPTAAVGCGSSTGCSTGPTSIWTGGWSRQLATSSTRWTSSGWLGSATWRRAISSFRNSVSTLRPSARYAAITASTAAGKSARRSQSANRSTSSLGRCRIPWAATAWPPARAKP